MAIGASAIQRWVENKYAVSVLLVVVPQTFGGLLNFNPHLHMLVSAGGFQESESIWTPIQFDKSELMKMWRLALCAYLWVALRDGAIRSGSDADQLEGVLKQQHESPWIHLRQSLYVEKEVPALRRQVYSSASYPLESPSGDYGSSCPIPGEGHQSKAQCRTNVA